MQKKVVVRGSLVPARNVLLTLRKSYNMLASGGEFQRWAKGAHVRTSAQEDALKDHFGVIRKKASPT